MWERVYSLNKSTMFCSLELAGDKRKRNWKKIKNYASCQAEYIGWMMWRFPSFHYTRGLLSKDSSHLKLYLQRFPLWTCSYIYNIWWNSPHILYSSCQISRTKTRYLRICLSIISHSPGGTHACDCEEGRWRAHRWCGGELGCHCLGYRAQTISFMTKLHISSKFRQARRLRWCVVLLLFSPRHWCPRVISASPLYEIWCGKKGKCGQTFIKLNGLESWLMLPSDFLGHAVLSILANISVTLNFMNPINPVIKKRWRTNYL